MTATARSPRDRKNLSTHHPRCGEQVRRPTWAGERDGCRNVARFRVDGVGQYGALYSAVPMCARHRAKYDAAGYRSWEIEP